MRKATGSSQKKAATYHHGDLRRALIAAALELGVRYWLNEETEFLAQHVHGLAYVIVDPSRFIEIYFSHRRDVEPQRSADQDFLYDPVFRSDEGEYALGFAIEDLSESELRSIDGAPGTLSTFRPLG
jgi:hypothetical protein